MEQSTIDRVARTIASKRSRRSLLGAMAISALGTLGSRTLTTDAAADGTPVIEEGPPPLPDPGAGSGGEASGEIKRGAIRGNFEHFCRIVPYREVDGLAIMEDDIIIGTAEEVDGSDCVLRAGQAAPIDGQQYRWPYGLVPFAFHESLTDEARRRARTAIDFWNGLELGLTWIWWDQANSVLKQMLNLPAGALGAPDVVWFISPSDPGICMADLGRRGGAQRLVIGGNCTMGSLVHEMAHTAGLFHEQQRPDRDRYVRIVWENVILKERHNFELSSLVDLDIAMSPYDYGSIMHYPATAFSVNGEATILTPNGEAIGQREQLSTGDIAAIRRMYPYKPLCSCSSVAATCTCSW